MTPAETLVEIADLVASGPPLLGRTRLVSIDGPAGSGKTTLADGVARELRARGSSVEVLHLDDALDGWTGLDVGVGQLLTTVLVPLSDGRPGSYRRYDWVAKAWDRDVAVPVTDVLIVEGCGSAPRAAAAWTTLVAWVEADRATRLARGLARDGESLRAEWLAWTELEARVLERERVRERAHVHVDGAGRIVAR